MFYTNYGNSYYCILNLRFTVSQYRFNATLEYGEGYQLTGFRYYTDTNTKLVGIGFQFTYFSSSSSPTFSPNTGPTVQTQQPSMRPSITPTNSYLSNSVWKHVAAKGDIYVSDPILNISLTTASIYK